MGTRESITFFINGQRQEIAGSAALGTLGEFLRYERGLTGTKIVCAEGDCGACTVLVGSVHEAADGAKLRYKAVNSCILPLFSLDGSQVITVEGLRDAKKLHPVQQAMVEHFGSQCGYCTPGFICSMAALVEDSIERKREQITEKKARNWLTGNLCRCTGYEPILKAAQSVRPLEAGSLRDRYHDPAMLSELRSLTSRTVRIEKGDQSVHLPASLAEALELKARIAGLRVIGGSTDAGVLVNKGRERHTHVMSLQNIAELRGLRRDRAALEAGSCVTLTELQRVAETLVPELGRLLHVFASPQIKNQATLVGNVVNASPIGDCIPFLLVSGAEVELRSIAAGARRVPLESFYLGYKKLDLKPDELVTSIRIPLPGTNTWTKLYKVSRREDLDISVVTLAVAVELEGDTISAARVAFGGVGPTVLRMKELESAWIGAKFERGLFEKSGEILAGRISPVSDVRGSREFRLQLCRNLLLKFHDELAPSLKGPPP